MWSNISSGLGSWWVLGYRFSLCLYWGALPVPAVLSRTQSPVDLDVPSLHPLATDELFWTPGLAWTKLSFFMRRWGEEKHLPI